jgi:hypothetical protein
MQYEPLHIRIERGVRPNAPPVTVKDVVRRFGCSESHARSTLKWMVNDQTPPSMALVLGASPQKWVHS